MDATPAVFDQHPMGPVLQSSCNPAAEGLHRKAAEDLNQADPLFFGRVIYEMM